MLSDDTVADLREGVGVDEGVEDVVGVGFGDGDGDDAEGLCLWVCRCPCLETQAFE